MNVNLRTTLLVFAAMGLVASAFAPAAGADTEIPGKHPGECMQVYFFVYEVGPVTVDASDSCWSVIVESVDECEAGADVTEVDECREALEGIVEDTCSDILPGNLGCAVETDPCEFVSHDCNIDCTCDPIRPDPVR